jgi:hypothetical protein
MNMNKDYDTMQKETMMIHRPTEEQWELITRIPFSTNNDGHSRDFTLGNIDFTVFPPQPDRPSSSPSVTLYMHNLEADKYRDLPHPEKTHNGSYWKPIVVGSIIINVFRPW